MPTIIDGYIDEFKSIPRHDHASLSKAKTLWLFGEWEALAALDLEVLHRHPDRARLALLAASAHQQICNDDKAREYIRAALEWDCSPKSVAQILIAGVHNTLGRASVLKQDERRTTRHFRNAVALGDNPQETQLLSHARSVKEMARLGMLPQAVTLVEGLLEQSKVQQTRARHAAARAAVLDMEVDWLSENVLKFRKDKAKSKYKFGHGDFDEKGSADTLSPTSAYSLPPGTKQYYSLHGLDRKLEAYINYDNGYFVELGANDGITQSNTMYFEQSRGWRGILIEPILHNFLSCKINRSPQNKFYCAACVSFDYDKSHVSLTYSDLMTSASGLESDIEDPVIHAKSGEKYLKERDAIVVTLAFAKTLNSILLDAGAPAQIDLLSLDVEGAEIEVLKGINHSTYRFKYILVESRNLAKMKAYLDTINYRLVNALSDHDFLFSTISLAKPGM